MSQQNPVKHIRPTEKIEANLEQQEDLYVSGQFQGSLFSSADLFIEKTGSFIGEAHVASAYIRGTFHGNLEATQKIFLFESSFFQGVLDSPKANISLGAKCCGEVRIISQDD